jgi:diguanylate cyclase (GGDEF)-like protein
MSENALNAIDFEKYFQLLRDLLPEVTGIAVFAANGQLLVSTDMPPDAIDPERLHFLEADRIEGAPERKALWLAAMGPGRTAFGIDITTRFEESIGSLVVVKQCGLDAADSRVDAITADALQAVTACMEKEYELTTELNAMARELAGRYEELNLVYATKDDIAQFEHEADALNHLVQNCVDYLDVGMVILISSGRRQLFCATNRRDPIAEAYVLAQQFARELASWVEATRQAIVINESTDQRRANLCPGVPFKILACPVLDAAGDVVAVLIGANHMHRADFFNSDRNLLEAMARKAAKIFQANYDTLTGLIRQRGFEAALQDLLASARDQGVCHCVLNIDLDQLKVVNDTFGREAGDAVITRVADLLRHKVRTTDTVGYLGEGRYGVLLVRCPVDRALQVAENLRQEIEGVAFQWKQQAVQLTASVGMAAVEPHTTDIESVLEAAEIARDAAKESGRNRIQLYRHGDTALANRKSQMQWVTRLQHALRDDRFRIYCQAIQPIREESEDYHFEILLRLIDEEGAMVSPMTFIPAAERYQLMPVVDRWVVKNTLEMLSKQNLAKVQGEGVVSINLSGQSLTDELLVNYIDEQILPNNISPNCICFEITETAAIANLDAAQRVMLALKERGFRFSLDDFGTGLSSFAYLKCMPVDYLKIDGSFVRQIIEDPVSDTMVSAINQIGHVMGLKTVAEFVESDAIRERLEILGLDYLQGYEIHTPEPLEDYLAGLGQPRQARVGRP